MAEKPITGGRPLGCDDAENLAQQAINLQIRLQSLKIRNSILRAEIERLQQQLSLAEAGHKLQDAKMADELCSPCAAILAGVSPGSHLCAFYETKDDLLDLIVPFFEAGLDRGDLCLWMTPEGINENEVKGQIERGLEFHPARSFYLKSGTFERKQIAQFWDEKLRQALASHRSGARASGDTFWLQQNNWNAFLEYEADVNTLIADKPMTLLCTFPLTMSKAGDIFEVIRAHHFAIAKQKDEWTVVAAPALGDRHAEAADAAVRVLSLTPRERQVLDAIIDGHPNKIIAHNMAIDIRTVEAHRARMMRRLGVRTIVEAVRLGTVARFVT
jgi:DNA-binding CsgD family transcriptional regulator